MNIEPGELWTWHLAAYSVILFIAAFSCINLLTPIVIWVSFQKRLVTPVNKRSSHRSITPPFGGVAFYIVFILFISLLQAIIKEPSGYNIIAATSILFMVGLKDDLVHSTVKVKLLAQLLACVIILCSAKFMVFTGQVLNVIHLWQLFISIGILVFIINAFNLIDGIDGLAAMTGIIVCFVYGVVFYAVRDVFFLLLSIVIVGVLSAFLRFNVSDKKLKIFMGDCGSLIIGLMIGLCTLRILDYPSDIMLPGSKRGLGFRYLMICAILFLPFLDTIRIIIFRISMGKNPFQADKNHMHHVLINYGLSHIRTSLLLSALQICVIALFFIMSEHMGIVSLYIGLTAIYLLSALFVQIISNKEGLKIRI